MQVGPRGKAEAALKRNLDAENKTWRYLKVQQVPVCALLTLRKEEETPPHPGLPSPAERLEDVQAPWTADTPEEHRQLLPGHGAGEPVPAGEPGDSLSQLQLGCPLPLAALERDTHSFAPHFLYQFFLFTFQFTGWVCGCGREAGYFDISAFSL